MSNDTDTNAYEDEWAADKEATDAQTAADAGVAAGKKADADPDFDYDEPGTIDVLSAAKMEAAPAPLAEPVKALTFKETFAARRKAGDATFEWNGKKYTTDLKKPVATMAAPAVPKTLVTPIAKAPVSNKVPTPTPAPASQAPYARTSFSDGRKHAPEPKEVPSPAKTSFGGYGSSTATPGRTAAAVPPVNLVTAKVQAPAVAASVRAPGDSPARTSFSSGRKYAPEPEEVPSPTKTSFSSGRTYPRAPEANRR